MQKINQAVKFQLGLFTLVIIYYLIRLLGISDINLNLWQLIYWGNFIKDSLMLFIAFLLAYLIFNKVRLSPKSGPTIIKGRTLKQILFSIFILGWLAVVTHTIFDSLKLFLPFNLLPFYQFADLMDETIAHIFIYLPTQLTIIILALLEAQRPSLSRLNKKDLSILITSSTLIGLFWGLNLSEGNLSLVTSLPTMVIYLYFSLFIIKKHKLKLITRPWTLFSLLASLFSIISFSIWSLVYSSSTQLFMTLK